MEDLDITEKKEKKEDARITYLRELVKGVFGKVANKSKKISSNKAIVVIGVGKEKELNKCSFTEKYHVEYDNLFKFTFTYKKCNFEYAGSQKKDHIFNRDTAVKNAVALFKKKGVDINYIFNSQVEQYLFSRLIYKYIKQLLCVLFEEYDCNLEERDEQVKKKYDEVIAKIINMVSNNDIIDLIYTDAKINELEQVIDSEYNRDECNIALINKNYSFLGYYTREIKKSTEVVCFIKGHDRVPCSDIDIYSEGIPFPIKSNSRLPKVSEKRNVSVKIWYKSDWMYFCPSYFCFITKKSGSDDMDNLVKEKILDAGIELNKRYCCDKKVQYLQWMNTLHFILDKIYFKNYNTYFMESNYKEIKAEKGYLELETFFKNNFIDKIDPVIIYIYLCSVAIHNLCDVLDNFNFYTLPEYIDKNDKEFKNHCSYIKDVCNFKSIDTAIEKYRIFYNDNKKCIEDFLNKVVVTEGVYWKEDSFSEYNPYSFLKNSLEEYYDNLLEGKHLFIPIDY